jgi:DNA-binding CsgD family transcriptional regulator
VGDVAQAAGRRPFVVGRERERARLEAFVVDVPHGARGLVISGEPGIGKTALWAYAVHRSRDAGMRVLVARPAEEEMPQAGLGLVDLFEHVGPAAAVFDAADDPFARGRAVLETLRGLAEATPLIVAVDDVQWLDSISARALRFALRRLDAEPVGLVATVRAGSRADGLSGTGGALQPGRSEQLDLGPLTLGELRTVLAGTVESISRPTLRRIHEISGGNPLYAIELARALAGRRSHPAAGLALPESLQAAIARRLETVPPELAPLLETTSALGHTTVRELQETLTDVNADVLLAIADRQELLVIEESLHVRFSHPLIASAVYAGMGLLERRRLHARLAGQAVDPDVRARHLALSTDVPDEHVAGLLEEAATRASARGAVELATDFAEHSCRLTPPGETTAARRRALARIEHLAAAGEVSRALTLADELVASLPEGPARAEALVQRAALEDDDRATAEGLLLSALDEAGGDEALRGRALSQLAQLRRWRSGDLRGALDCAREALELVRRAGDRRHEVYAAAYLAHLETLSGTPNPDLMAQAVDLEEEIGIPQLAIGPRTLLAKQLLWGGELAAARSLLDADYASVVRAGREIMRPQHFYDLSLLECAAGNVELAEELAGKGVQAAHDAENPYAERELLYPLALARVWLGKTDEARATAARLRDEALQHDIRPLVVRQQIVLGLLELTEGDAAAAVGPLTDAAAWLDERGFAHPGAFPVLPDAIEALVLTGDLGAAEALLERLERQAVPLGSVWVRAASERSRGIVDLAAGRADDAAAALTRAVAAFDELGYRPDAARAQLVLGRASLRAGRRTLAADCLADARARFAAMGARRWEERACEELERAAPGRAAGELTATERQVAALVAEGMRNREIGQTLFMSVATVEAHLTRIYRKLDLRSRSELARLVVEGAVAVDDEPG